MTWFANHALQQKGLASVRPPGDPSLDAQQLWFALQRKEWASLALVPCSPECATTPVAVALAEVSGRHRGWPLLVLPGEKLDLAASAGLVAQLRLRHAAESGYDAIVVPLGPLSIYPAGIAVARAADAAVLCVHQGTTRVADARRVLDVIGREKFLGYVMVDGKGRR